MVAAGPVTAAWEAQNTTVAEVERQLARLIRELDRPREGDGAEGVTRSYPPPRASVLNFMIVADEAAEVEHAAEVIAAQATRNPSRTLLLVAQPEAPEASLDAAITTHCAFRPSGTAHLCFEQVELVARGATADHLASVAEPLLVTNLPTFLWWLGRPPASDDPLLPLCDRLLVDSADFRAAAAELAALDACAAAAEGGLELGDLGWRRLGAWRQLIAQFFDPPDARRLQRHIHRVDIDYVADHRGPIGAAPLLLVGWLASRLGWQLEDTVPSAAALDLRFAAPHVGGGALERIVEVHIRPGPTVADLCELLAVRLAAGAEAEPAQFAVHWDDNRTYATTQVVLPGVRELERMVRLERLTTAELLARELELHAADGV